MARPTVAVLLADAAEPPPGLEQVRDHAEVRLVDNAPALIRALERAEILFAWDFRSTLLRSAWPHAGRLRWIHAGSTGVDAVLLEEVVASDVVVTNTRGVFERPIAEYVLGLILMFAKDLRRTLGLRDRREWHHRETEMLAGRRVLVLGAGGVGREIVRLLRAVGMEVEAVGRVARENDPELGQVHALAGADGLLAQTEFLVLALPLTEQTRGVLDGRRLALLPAHARIINVGRGPLLDEAALLDALRSGQVAGAALDVFEREPLPPAHSFWSMDNVIVSPHMSGDRIGWQQAVVAGFAENLRRWRAGEPLLNVVEKDRFRAPLPVSAAAAAEPGPR
jgi:phosphoglycerate dehydrogenase-like enzyme